MNIEFGIHGVPKGLNIWGITGDSYYESFYGNYDIYEGASPAFVVEIRKKGSHFCSYYSYIRTQNVLAKDGRSGSYFGMTLCIDSQYCTDAYSLFDLFEQLYKQKIGGSILVKSGDVEQFLIAGFEEKDTLLQELKNAVISTFKESFSNDLEMIDSSFTKQHATSNVYYNINDINSETFFNSTKVFGKVIISSEYPSKDNIIKSLSSIKVQKEKSDSDIFSLQQQNKELLAANAQLKMIVNESSGTIDRLSGENKKLTDANSSLSSRISQLEQDLNNANRGREIHEIAEQLDSSMRNLSNILRQYSESTNHVQNDGTNGSIQRNYKNFDNWKRWIPIGIILILVLLLIIVGRKGLKIRSQENQQKVRIEQYEVKIKTLKAKYDSLLCEYDEVIKINNEYTSQLSKKNLNASAKINISGYSGVGSLSLNTSYIVSVKPYDEINGEWRVDGFDINNDDRKSNNISIKPNKVGKVIISYYVGDVQVATRKLDAK